MMRIILTILLQLLVLAPMSLTADSLSNLSVNRNLATNDPAPPIIGVENNDIKRPRNFAEQPPTIPHQIDNYQIDINANKCMFCHARHKSTDTSAPMVSVTHFADRDGQILADITPRRYFCTQCHVPQNANKLLVPNVFKDIMDLTKPAKNTKTKKTETPQ